MQLSISGRQSPARAQLIIWRVAGTLFLFHLLGNAFTSYGYFRDELYYLACSRRLAWGYVDHPPLSVFILAGVRWLLGESLFAIRLLPALALSSTVVFTGLMVRQMKGGLLAVFAACLAVALAPIFLAMGTFYSMNSFDILLWAVAAYLLLLLSNDPKPARWILLGIVMGLGLLNKIGFLWFGAGLLAGMLLTPLGRQLLTPWPYLSAGIALLLFSPYILWNIQHDFAHLEFMQNAVLYKYSSQTRADFLLGLLLLLNPSAIPLWCMGIFFYFFHSKGKQYRLLGMVFLTALCILLINAHSKSEYLAPAFPLLFAGGGVLLEQLSSRYAWRRTGHALLVFLLLTGLLLAPLAKPLLPVPVFVRYAGALGIGPSGAEGKEMAELPQFYADMFGWEPMALKVSEVYQSLPEEERRHARVYTQNYGEAGALEHYSKQYLLPPVISGHNNYWLWGYGGQPLQTLIIVGGDREDHLKAFEEVEQVAVHTAAYAMPYENNLPVYVCRKARLPADIIWQGTRKFI